MGVADPALAWIVASDRKSPVPEYPLGAPAGTKPRDRVKILEDADGDGRADKVTNFALLKNNQA